MKKIILMLTLILVFSLAISVIAAEYPNQPINVVVQYSAGGGTDTVIRAIASAMERNSDFMFNVSNQPGANGSIATDFVKNKPADGYWLLGVSQYDRGLRVMDYVDFTPWKEFQYFKMGNSLECIAVSTDSPIKTFDQFIEMAKENPGKLKISNSGIGGVWHLGMELIASKAGIKVEAVPYGGGAPATLAAIKGEVDAVSSGLHEQVEFIKAGRLRPLAVVTKEPYNVAGYGEVPAVMEFLPEMEAFLPYGGIYSLAVRRDTPVEIIEKLKELFIKASKDPKLEEMFAKRSFKLAPLVGKEVDKKAALNESLAAWMMWDLGLGEVDPAELGIPTLDEFDAWWPPADYEPKL